MSDLAELLKAQGASIDADDDFDAINQLYLERGWGDGLPIVPPTAGARGADARVLRPAVGRADREDGAALRRGDAAAACRQRGDGGLPAGIFSAGDARDRGDVRGAVQSVRHPGHDAPCAPLVIVNGPCAGSSASTRATTRSGRARAATRPSGARSGSRSSISAARFPGLGDMSTFGAPAKFSYCVAENEAASPWEPLHVERGFPAEASTVTVVGAECPHNVNDHESLTAEGILTTIAGTMATTGTNDIYYSAQPVVVMGPEHAKTVARRLLQGRRQALPAGARDAAAGQILEGKHRAPLPRDVQGEIRQGGAGRAGARGAARRRHHHCGDRRRGQALGVHPDVRRDQGGHAGAEARDGTLAKSAEKKKNRLAAFEMVAHQQARLLELRQTR